MVDTAAERVHEEGAGEGPIACTEEGEDRARAADAALVALRSRRSVGRLLEPAPGRHELQAILEAAALAPDHKRLRPFRFLVIAGEARVAVGRVLADAYRAHEESAGREVAQAELDRQASKLLRAPMVVAVLFQPVESPGVPRDEQLAAAAAAAENALVAATALGYGSMWRTGAGATDPSVLAALGVSPQGSIVAFLYLGTLPPRIHLAPRTQALDGIVSWYEPAGTSLAP